MKRTFRCALVLIAAAAAMAAVPVAVASVSRGDAPERAASTVSSTPAPAGATLSGDYAVTVGSVPASVYATDVGRFAQFSFTGTAHVTVVLTAGAVSSAVVRPLAAGITPAIHGNTAEFDVAASGDLSVELNGNISTPLFLFARPPLAAPPSDPAGVTVMHYRAGSVYEVGTVKLASNTILDVEEGAVLRGQLDVEDAHDVTVRGRGVIEGWTRKNNLRNTRVLRIVDSSGVTVDGPLLLNADNWAAVVAGSSAVHIVNSKIISACSANTTCDGIDIVGSRAVTVDHVFVRSQDDTIAVKNAKAPWAGGTVSNVEFRNLVVFNGPGGNGLEIGYEIDDRNITDVRFRNIDIIHKTAKSGRCNRAAISIHNKGAGTVSGVSYSDVRIEDTTEHVFALQTDYPDVGCNGASAGTGKIQNISFTNISVLVGANVIPSAITGRTDGQVTGVTFTGLTFSGTPILSAADGHFVITHAGPVQFLPAP
jgi:hypothetical protein